MSILNSSGAAYWGRKALEHSRRGKQINLLCESLETRQLLSASATVSSPSQPMASPFLDVSPLVSAGPTGLSPQQLQNAYGVNQITFAGGAISGNGAGQTIAIVDAYNDPNIASDLATFDSQYGLSAPPSFVVKNLGATTTDPGWALETSLDVEWAHALAPKANIVLVESSSATLNGLFGAVSYASQLSGVSVVSMSWGTPEFWGEWNYDSLFTTPKGHTGVTYVASSGDSGAWFGPMYPSVSPNVLAVGGTTLTLSSSGTYSLETGWSGSTGGFSGLDS
jgi:subtilase family serine protease